MLCLECCWPHCLPPAQHLPATSGAWVTEGSRMMTGWSRGDKGLPASCCSKPAGMNMGECVPVRTGPFSTGTRCARPERGRRSASPCREEGWINNGTQHKEGMARPSHTHRQPRTTQSQHMAGTHPTISRSPPPALQEPSAQVWGVFYNQVTYPGTSGGWQSQCDGRKGDCTLQGKLGQGALLHHQALGQGCLHQTRSISLLLWELQSSAWDKQLRTGSRSGVAKSQLSARTPRARGTRDPYRDSTCTRKALGRAAEEGSTSPHWAEGPTMQEQLG